MPSYSEPVDLVMLVRAYYRDVDAEPTIEEDSGCRWGAIHVRMFRRHADGLLMEEWRAAYNEGFIREILKDGNKKRHPQRLTHSTGDSDYCMVMRISRERFDSREVRKL